MSEKRNRSVWMGLVALTSVGAWSRSLQDSRAAVGLILALAAVKCGVLGWNYMELRAAHWIWRATMSVLVLTILGGVAAATMR